MRINDRAQMSTSSIDDLPDSAFAYIEPGGTKDSSGKTTPRSLRHFPIHDAAHTRNALARLSQSPFGAKAKAKVMAAATKFGIDTSSRAAELAALEAEGWKFYGDARASDVDTTLPDPPSLSGQYEPANVQELQSLIAMLASEPTIHQNSDVPPIRQILDKLIAAAVKFNAVGMIPPSWNSPGTLTVAPRAWTGDREERVFTFECELRAGENGKSILAGYASTFNEPYQVRDKYGEFDETMLPGAWSRSLAEVNEKKHLLIGHGANPIPLASTTRGLLRLYQDSHGLGYEAELNPTRSPLHQDVVYAVESGAMDEMSVGMRIPDGGDAWTQNNTKRSISDATLIEISVLPRGANSGTEAFMRKEELLAELRRLEDSLHAHTGMTIEAAQRMLVARYETSTTAQAHRALLEALR